MGYDTFGVRLTDASRPTQHGYQMDNGNFIEAACPIVLALAVKVDSLYSST